ncbi:MFS transporter [Paenibacillus sp. NEAU-GSW1]|uniref:MFS transporter n=1 Tax=Paenibacillus sp. NEAU-GSW1 TaxID=2682486 RepID=UPI0020A62985|nr:MFS transporter [Paenibacillus sp. NEAU-GSW1]
MDLADERKTTEMSAARASAAKRETTALRAFSFSAYSTQALLVSYIPLYFMDQGFSEHQIGIIYATGPFISIFANILLGWTSDKFQTIKKLLTLLLFGQLAMLSLLFPVEHFAIICVVMTAFYFFQTPINPLSDSLVLLSSQYTGTPYALIRIFGSLGFAVSAYAFGWLLRAVGSEWTLPIGLVTITITIILSFLLRDYRTSSRKIEFSGFFQLMRKPSVVTFFFVMLLVSISHRMYEGFLAVTLRQIGASDSLIGLAWLTSAASEIPVLFLLGKYGHRFKELPLLAVASVMYAIRMWLLGDLDDPRLVIVTQLMHSVTFGIYFSTALRYISQLIPDEFRSSGQAVYAVVWTGLAGFISGTAGGYVFEAFGRSAFFQAGSLLAILAAFGFMASHMYNRSRI